MHIDINKNFTSQDTGISTLTFDFITAGVTYTVQQMLFNCYNITDLSKLAAYNISRILIQAEHNGNSVAVKLQMVNPILNAAQGQFNLKDGDIFEFGNLADALNFKITSVGVSKVNFIVYSYL